MPSRKRKKSPSTEPLMSERQPKKVRFNKMVGIPRSKGCRMCVQRRVKCDQTKPFCNRCIKADRECPGYEPAIKFQDEGPKLRQLYRHETSEQTSTDPSSPENPQFEYSTEVPLTLRLTHTTKSDPDREEPRKKRSFETSFLAAIMSPTVSQAGLLSNFIASLSPGNNPTLQPTFRCTALFLHEVAEQTGGSPVLEWAIRAVSLSHLGRQVEDQHLVQLSRQMYRHALLTLNTALQDPVEGISSKTLSATILLSFYEVINCTDKDSWVRHAGGAGHLMRIRGPDRHRAGLGRVCFLAYRHSLVIEAFISRTSTFLATQPWLDLARDIQQSMPDRTPICKLVDDYHLLIVDIPGFLQSVQTPNATNLEKRKLLATGQALRGNLKVLHGRIMTTLDETDQQITEHASSTPDAVFPIQYSFPNIATASLLCGYWSILTVLNINLAGLENAMASQYRPLDPNRANVNLPSSVRQQRRTTDASSSSPTTAATTTAAVDNYRTENLSYSRSSCQSADFLTGSAFLGPLYLIFALRVAYRTFERTDEKEWVRGRLAALSWRIGLARVIYERLDGGIEEMRASVSESPEIKRRLLSSFQSSGGEGLGVAEAEETEEDDDEDDDDDGDEEGEEEVEVEEEDLSRRTSVSLQEIEMTGVSASPVKRRRSGGFGVGTGGSARGKKPARDLGTRKGKGVLR